MLLMTGVTKTGVILLGIDVNWSLPGINVDVNGLLRIDAFRQLPLLWSVFIDVNLR